MNLVSGGSAKWAPKERQNVESPNAFLKPSARETTHSGDRHIRNCPDVSMYLRYDLWALDHFFFGYC